MSGFDNEVLHAAGMRLEPSNAQEIMLMQKAATDVSKINHTGNPEGVVSANPSSLCHDPVSGNVYIKSSGVGNTGWALIDSSASTILTNHSIALGTGTNALGSVGPTATAGQIVQSAGASADPVFSTATYPAVGTSTGSLLRADGTNWSVTTSTYPDTNAISTLLYASAANVMSALATANNGMLVTSATGVPSILAGPGVTGKVLQSNAAAAPSFSTATYPSVGTSTGSILRADGTNWSATTSTYPNTNAINTILYASAANVMSALPTANSALLNTNGAGTPSLNTSPTISGTFTAGTGLATSAGNVTASAGNLAIPATNGAGTQGILTVAAARFLSSFGSSNTFLGASSGNTTTSGTGANTGIGTGALGGVSTGQANTCVGRLAGGGALTTASFNTSLGSSSLFNCASDYNTAIGANSCFCSAGNTGQGNCYLGYATGFNQTSADFNVGLGYQSLSNLLTGDNNLALGPDSGTTYNGAESNNILLQNAGVNGESNVMRLGTAGSGAKQVNKAYIAGINGVTVTGTAVLCATDGQCGTVASSERYKENIKDMPVDMSVLMLRPIEFNYRSDENKTTQYGLLAEDVDRDFPYLCFYNDEKQPESVKYHELCTFLLHEVQKLNRRVQDLERKAI